MQSDTENNGLPVSWENCRKLIETLPEALFLENLDGTIIEANQQTCQILGCQKEELIGLNVEELVSKDSSTFFPDELEGVTLEDRTIETINKRKGGEEIPVEIKGKVIEVRGSKRLLVSMRDISSRQQMKQELKEIHGKLKRSRERYKSYFDELGDSVYITKVGGEDHGKILDVNSTATEQTGYSRRELLGMNIEGNLAIPDTNTINYQEGDEKLARGETITFKVRRQ